LWPRFDKNPTKEKLVPESVPANPEPGVQAPTTNTQPPEAKPATDERISIDAFMNVELRTAKVIAAEAVPKSKKLIKLQVDLGTEQRTVLAGIAEAYLPESLVGRTIVVVANLKPAKLMGIESNGMVPAASPDGGQPVLVTVDAEPGWRVR
jgi:methionyl-tRNA synthetase